jgi:hypothetical protein
MEEMFLENFEEYSEKCNLLKENDGNAMNDPFGEKRGLYGYADLATRLRKIKENILLKQSRKLYLRCI